MGHILIYQCVQVQYSFMSSKQYHEDLSFFLYEIINQTNTKSYMRQLIKRFRFSVKQLYIDLRLHLNEIILFTFIKLNNLKNLSRLYIFITFLEVMAEQNRPHELTYKLLVLLVLNKNRNKTYCKSYMRITILILYEFSMKIFMISIFNLILIIFRFL